MFEGTQRYTQLGNALAVLADVVTGDAAVRLIEELRQGKTTECSLAMKPFYYDALLKTDKEKYAGVVLSEIRRNYTFMLENGATSVWETMEGDFGHNSLWHGWKTHIRSIISTSC